MTGDRRIEAGVRAAMAAVAGPEAQDVGRDEDLAEALAVDSLQGLQILAGVEKRFGVRLPDDELIHLRTVGRIADAVARLEEGGES
jgi:acyl carrier protein